MDVIKAISAVLTERPIGHFRLHWRWVCSAGSTCDWPSFEIKLKQRNFTWSLQREVLHDNTWLWLACDGCELDQLVPLICTSTEEYTLPEWSKHVFPVGKKRNDTVIKMRLDLKKLFEKRERFCVVRALSCWQHWKNWKRWSGDILSMVCDALCKGNNSN